MMKYLLPFIFISLMFYGCSIKRDLLECNCKDCSFRYQWLLIEYAEEMTKIEEEKK